VGARATDLTLRVRPHGDELRVAFAYAERPLSNRRVSTEMLDGLLAALDALARHARRPIGRLPVMSPASGAQTLAATNTRPYDPARHAFRRFESTRRAAGRHRGGVRWRVGQLRRSQPARGIGSPTV